MKIFSFDELLTKQMTRREFLLHLGLLMLAITGISSLMSTISDPNLVNNNKKQSKLVRGGFGSGPYGA